MIDTTYLTDEEKEELRIWNARVANKDPKLRELHKVDRARIRTEWDCKIDSRIVRTNGYSYKYRSREISLDDLNEEDMSTFAIEPDAAELLEIEEDELRKNELIQKLYKAMSTLTEDERAMIIALEVYGYTEQEVASKLGTYQQKINRRRNAILKKLRKNF